MWRTEPNGPGTRLAQDVDRSRRHRQLGIPAGGGAGASRPASGPRNRHPRRRRPVDRDRALRPPQFRGFRHHGAIRVVQADATRVGGVTEWLQAAAQASARGLRVAPHGPGCVDGHRPRRPPKLADPRRRSRPPYVAGITTGRRAGSRRFDYRIVACRNTRFTPRTSGFNVLSIPRGRRKAHGRVKGVSDSWKDL
ncbi:enolase C-terminal domain-like protein [Nonomuraea rosea]|uniref:enolase C-terminal domain-like protein n=1 Tax=Nonomuraea rosea TaxID=638574 RepID=UPI003CD071A7